MCLWLHCFIVKNKYKNKNKKYRHVQANSHAVALQHTNTHTQRPVCVFKEPRRLELVFFIRDRESVRASEREGKREIKKMRVSE